MNNLPFYLTTLLILASFGIKAQKNFSINKAPGDTLYYQDFDSTANSFNNSLPLCWNTLTNSGPAWEWSDSSGTTLTPPIVSPSDTNGFLRSVFPSPPPVPPVLPIDNSVSSCAIAILPTSSVLVSWYQSMNYCCSVSDQLVLELSTDSINWTTYSAVGRRGPNSPSINGERVSIDVSSTLANQDTVYLRFRWTGSTAYYWMIDDFLIEEGPGIVGIEENMNPTSIQLFPNPTKGLLLIETDDITFQQVEIRNTIGALVFQDQITMQRMRLDLSHLEKGLYFVSLIAENSREVKKIIIQ